MVPRMKKRSKRKPKGLKSDGLDVPSTASPIAPSGQYLAAAEAGTLTKLTGLRKKLGSKLGERHSVEERLKQINNPVWLDELAEQMRKREKRFDRALPEIAERLEREKRELDAEISKVKQKIKTLDSSFDGLSTDTLAAPILDSSLSTAALPKTSHNSTPEIQYRNARIRKYAYLPDREICIKLDAEMGRRKGEPTPGLPESWQEEPIKVTSFVDAYDNPALHRKVQKLISVAKTAS